MRALNTSQKLIEPHSLPPPPTRPRFLSTGETGPQKKRRRAFRHPDCLPVKTVPAGGKAAGVTRAPFTSLPWIPFHFFSLHTMPAKVLCRSFWTVEEREKPKQRWYYYGDGIELIGLIASKERSVPADPISKTETRMKSLLQVGLGKPGMREHLGKISRALR